jgi:deoxyuridine 5'-triphosphate nucleotidohydrolase
MSQATTIGSKYPHRLATKPHPPIRLEYRVIHPDAKIPFRSRGTDAGYDLFSVDSAIIQPSGGTASVRTGLCISAPPGYYYTIDGRSSLWSKGVFPCRGIIDASYTGPISVYLVNNGSDPYKIEKGDRVAQMILHRIQPVEFDEVEEFSPEYSLRGVNSFGSSGR